MTENKPCIACAVEIKASALLCKHCKTRQDDENFEKATPKPRKKGAPASAKEEAPSKSGFIFAAVLVVAVAAVGVYFSNGQSVNFNFTQSDESGSSDTNSQSQEVTYEPHERYHNWLEDNLFPRDGSEAMVFALDALNFYDPDGRWEEDTFSNESPLVAGVLLDTYSVFPAGCAIWWFNSQEDLLDAVEEGSVNFFSESWFNWKSALGPSILIIANSYGDSCYQNALDVLELEMDK